MKQTRQELTANDRGHVAAFERAEAQAEKAKRRRNVILHRSVEALDARGFSLRDIADLLKISHMFVSRVLHDPDWPRS